MDQTSKPLLAAAFLCERLLHERDGVMSAIRLVDTWTIPGLQPEAPAGVVPGFRCYAFIMFKSGAARGRYTVTLRLRSPSGERREIAKHPIELKGDHHGASLNIELRMSAKEMGLFWIDVLLDGEQVTSMPLKLQRRAEDASPRPSNS